MSIVRMGIGGAAICAVALAASDALVAQRAGAGPVRTINITVSDPVGERMEYSLKQIVAKPGERLRIQLISTGQLPKVVMAHNFVLLGLGSDAKAFAEAGAALRDTDYIAPALRRQVIASTTMVGPGERAQVVVTVPARPGTYPYLCTFPGHYAAGMAGVLVVK